MILEDRSLIAWAGRGGLKPFTLENVNPASIDLCVADTFVDLNTSERFQASELDLVPGRPILATTLEYVTMPFDCSGVVYLKSSMARLGLDHALAGWVDPGFHGELTLELHSHRPVTISVGRCVVQLVLMRMEHEPMRTYIETGRYNGQTGPTEARILPGAGLFMDLGSQDHKVSL